MATASAPRVFGVQSSDEYWAARRRRAAVGEAPIHRRLAQLVDRFAPHDAPLLSCGAGEGHVMRLCSRSRRVYGVDLAADALARYDFPHQLALRADLNDGIPDFPEPFGAIVASWLLHWLDSPVDFLREARRRLAPGGVVILNIPNITHYRYRLQMLVGRFPAISASHKNFQTPREVEQTIRQAGLCIVRRMPAKATLRARLRPTLLARDIIYVLRAADDRSAVSRGVALSPFPTEGKSDSLLYLWSTPAGKRLVKVFTGRSAAARRDRAEAAQRLWRKHGFPVPELYAVSPPGASRPHLVQELVEGPTLRQRLRDDAISLSQKLQEVDQVLSSMRSRHARALAERDARWVHPDANTGNILLAPSGPVWIDLESLPVGDSLDAAAAELAKFALCVAAELGPAHFADIARRMLSHYRGLEAIPRRFCERTLARRLQPLHRWRDRRRKMAHPQTPTKYDLADRWQRALSAQPIAA